MTTSTRRLFWASGFLSFSLSFFSAYGEEPAPRFDHAVRQDFFLGFTGNRAALERAMKTCEAVLAGNPAHAEALVWHGSGLFFQAGGMLQKGDLPQGMQRLGKGLQEMDEAVRLAPRDIGVRIPRGATLLLATRQMQESPQRQALLQRGLQDYQAAYDIQKASLGDLSEHAKGELLFGLAEGYERGAQPDQAAVFLALVQSELPNTEYARRARLLMDGQPLSPAQRSCVGCHTGK